MSNLALRSSNSRILVRFLAWSILAGVVQGQVLTTTAPTSVPTAAPVTLAPTDVPTTAPVTLAPTEFSTVAPATMAPTKLPTASPVTLAPTNIPTVSPETLAPTDFPTAAPITLAPTGIPTAVPVALVPTDAPTAAPVTQVPTDVPSVAPVTLVPTDVPTLAPVTLAPTDVPSVAPVTLVPTEVPTSAPVTVAPTNVPSVAPVTLTPTDVPTATPMTLFPTDIPTAAPVTLAPTNAPTAASVTLAPTGAPTTAPLSLVPTIAPTPAPITMAPTDIPTVFPFTLALTNTPTALPVTLVPTNIQTETPVTASPVLVTTAPVTPSPTNIPTLAPTNVPTAAPVTAAPILGTGAPTNAPTRAPTNTPTLVPTNGPTKKPTLSPTKSPTRSTTNMPTTSPIVATDRPTTAPQEDFVEQEARFESVSITLEGVTELDATAIAIFESTTKTWFQEYYNGLPTNSNQRMLVFGEGVDGVDGMLTSVFVVSQQALPADPAANRALPVNTIVYTQEITYVAQPSIVSDAEELIVIPYQDTEGNARLVQELQSFGDETYVNLLSPIAPPIVTPPEGGGGGLSGGAIAGIVIGASVFLLAAVYGGFVMMGDGDGAGYVDPDTRPPAAFNVSATEDPSTLQGDETQRGAEDASLAEYGDQSVDTMDFDYSKAYGGRSDASDVSSAGGTFGDNTRQSMGDVVSGTVATRAALGRSVDSESGFATNVKEEVLVIDAPPGKLGAVIDTPDDGAPVVHAVKDSSVIADQIRVGDKLVAVDDEDVRSMTAIQVSKLISRKSANPSRKLTLVRTSVVG